ncbi:zinc/iron-chelating domain-containing protein [Chromatium weissei]|nr:zinc/iron-chelating domain-containing protein [Chromatium weissei]
MTAQRAAAAPPPEQHFACTGCGKCCHGWLPLTVADAFANAGRFPLALVWTSVSESSQAFDLTVQLGTAVRISKRQRVAVLIAPTAYLPPSFPCPALSPENRCTIQAEKPLRCRTMPFYPYRRAADQADLLVPRKGWACDISTTAPLVYQQRKIVERDDFDAERAALLAQAPLLRSYADTTLKHYPSVLARLIKAAQNPATGQFIVGFSSFLRQQKMHDPITFAQAQHPLLLAFAEKAATSPTLATYHRYYQESATELAWFANAKPS